MNLWNLVFGKREKMEKSQEKKQSGKYQEYLSAKTFSYDLDNLINHTLRAEKLEISKEQRRKALELVDPEYHLDFEVFLETGDADPEFKIYLYNNENTQKAVKMVFNLKEADFNDLKANLERGKIPKDTYETALALIDSKYQQDFKRFVATGEFSKEFLKYFDNDEKAQRAAHMVLTVQAKQLEALGKYLREEKALEDELNK